MDFEGSLRHARELFRGIVPENSLQFVVKTQRTVSCPQTQSVYLEKAYQGVLLVRNGIRVGGKGHYLALILEFTHIQ